MRTFSVVTTFNKSGYDEYGFKCISSYLDYWPDNSKLFVYAEDINIKENHKIKIININDLSNLTEFKNKNKNIKELNGYKTEEYNFLYDFVKFSHKSFVMFDAIKNLTTDWIIWLDGDTISHSPIDDKFFSIFDTNALALFLERENMFSETGFLAFNRRHPKILKYLKLAELQYNATMVLNDSYYNSGYTDCHIFDYVRKKMFIDDGVYFKNVSNDLTDKHPFINSILGNYMDHLKGQRKITGKSRSIDLTNTNLKSHNYWR